MSKLHVLRDLGVNCIWFTPLYTSPQVDNGYDVADYRDIAPAYGTIENFKEFLDMAHSMGIRVIMEMVLNHSSDECMWFRESRKFKDNPYRNYYIWQLPKPGGSEPNNWGSYFREGNGSAWKFDQTTGEYYLHQYSIKMPDCTVEGYREPTGLARSDGVVEVIRSTPITVRSANFDECIAAHPHM